MPDSNQSNRLLEVEKQLARNSVLVDKFDAALDKISEVSLNVSKLLAVHEQRIEAQEEAARFIVEQTESRRKEMLTVNSELHEKVNSVEQGLRREMADGQKEILNEIKSLRSDVEDLGDDLTEKHDALKTGLESDFSNKIETVSGRVTKLERLAYIVIGGATVLGFLISQALGVLQIFH